jgi:hypothetical protein
MSGMTEEPGIRHPAGVLADQMKPFRVHVPDDTLLDLRRRLSATRSLIQNLDDGEEEKRTGGIESVAVG